MFTTYCLDTGIPVKAEPLEDDWLAQLPPPGTYYDLTDEQQHEAVLRLRNPIAKIKKDSQFTWKTVADRMKVVGLDPYRIDLDEPTLRFMFNRHYLHHLYGGSFVNSFPHPAPEKTQVHLLDDFMCLLLEFNPHAPVNPGDPGLFFGEKPADNEGGFTRRVHRVFVRVRDKPALWSYMGQYRMYVSESLRTDEFARQPLAVSTKDVGKDILEKSWGSVVTARVCFRKEHHREPTEDEISEVVEDNQHMAAVRRKLAWEDIVAAYDRGEEEIGVWAMKCVSYDIQFQRVLARNYKYYTPPKGKSKDSDTLKASQKRKRGSSEPETPEPKLEYDNGDDDVDFDAEVVEVKHLKSEEDADMHDEPKVSPSQQTHATPIKSE
ncbi:uncharacterized protein B0H18DRAFT_943959 [Fomitopsis serialis]|uniref:uncharacterized protein n=1 Tax=Fomitopsis serialis TaxID=139415 RepID=UPI0020074CE8|nr:uncharacterized protein B0H18DRAFT_943959 [Neoantrodia serialis]KAH9911763.1 hypothetical protein B0H18DRAFT_943959 [Neoantrodia serialis]